MKYLLEPRWIGMIKHGKFYLLVTCEEAFKNILILYKRNTYQGVSGSWTTPCHKSPREYFVHPSWHEFAQTQTFFTRSGGGEFTTSIFIVLNVSVRRNCIILRVHYYSYGANVRRMVPHLHGPISHFKWRIQMWYELTDESNWSSSFRQMSK